ncbi:hypothetical protein PAHAL_1G449100 [Panicum hallii]|uniref:Uncharacterized protein n=1 Tax=Panicum hallii TaxID=206008 RepID=A0A2T8KYE2_9POAL|nr:hypothetical protein PAHAL_1G449100 [Panicum hallii]
MHRSLLRHADLFTISSTATALAESIIYMPLLALLPGIVLFSSLFLMISWLLQLGSRSVDHGTA